MYRHCLAHQDEMRVLKSKDRTVEWRMHIFGGGHLKITEETPKHYTLQIDPVVFYADIVNVLKKAQSKTWGGKVKARYEDWFVLDLDKKITKKPPDPLSPRAIALDEISKLK
jgi:hypothetical protein